MRVVFALRSVEIKLLCQRFVPLLFYWKRKDFPSFFFFFVSQILLLGLLIFPCSFARWKKNVQVFFFPGGWVWPLSAFHFCCWVGFFSGLCQIFQPLSCWVGCFVSDPAASFGKSFPSFWGTAGHHTSTTSTSYLFHYKYTALIERK